MLRREIEEMADPFRNSSGLEEADRTKVLPNALYRSICVSSQEGTNSAEAL